MCAQSDRPLLLVIDIGNTNTVYGLYREHELVASFRSETRRNRTADEYYALLAPLLERQGFTFEEVKDAVMSTVVPPSVYPMVKFSREILGRELLNVDYRLETGIKLRYHRPEEMGADRLVNAAFAYRRYGASIIVDFGTATTFDVISSSGEYLGGCITPGIRISMDALFAYAARLPRVEVGRPDNVIGRSTEEAMQSGVYYGYVALVDGLVERLTGALDDDPEVIATGGLAPLIARDAVTVKHVEENLTLESLRKIYHEHRGEL